MIKLGTSDLSKAYVGSTEVSKMYLGSDLVYEASSVQPSILPEGYTELDYLSSDGAYYVDSGILQKGRNFVFEIKFKWTGTVEQQFETFFGYMTPSGSTPRFGFHKHNGKWMYGTNATNTTNIDVDNNIHIARIESKVTGNKESFILDGNLISTTTTSAIGIGNNSIPIYMFCRNRNTSIDNPASVDIYYIKYTYYTDSDYTSVKYDKNFIPCYNRDNVYGMYESIEGVFCPKTLI